MLKNSKSDYGIISKGFHWVIAILMIGLIFLGWVMTDLLDYNHPWYHDSFYWHKALGIVVLGLATLKLFWGLTSRLPELDKNLKPWESMSAHGVHKVLYLLMFLLPMSGYLLTTSTGDYIDFFGILIPALLSNMKSYSEFFGDIHEILGYGAAGLISLHVLAALKHHFINKDKTLRKML